MFVPWIQLPLNLTFHLVRFESAQQNNSNADKKQLGCSTTKYSYAVQLVYPRGQALGGMAYQTRKFSLRSLATLAVLFL